MRRLRALVCLAPLALGCDDHFGFQRVNTLQGFGDAKNKYSWSMAELGGKIYVGTLNVGLPLQLILDLPREMEAGPLAVLEQYESLVDTDGAEIWCYAPAQDAWTKVLETEHISPRILGFRKMIVFQEALYAGTLTADSPAQVWMSPGGENWSVSLQLAGENRSVRGMAVVGDRLYVGTENRARMAELWRFDSQTWERVATFENVPMISALTEMDGRLYIGTWDGSAGFELFCFDDERLERVVSKEEHDPADLAILSMRAFGVKLYLGTMNYGQGFGLYSYDPGANHLELVGERGLGNSYNFYAWQLEVHQERLYLGAFNILRVAGPVLWSTADGTSWEPEMAFGPGERDNWGVRTLLSVGESLYVGTANNLLFGRGTEVWLRDGAGIARN